MRNRPWMLPLFLPDLPGRSLPGRRSLHARRDAFLYRRTFEIEEEIPDVATLKIFKERELQRWTLTSSSGSFDP